MDRPGCEENALAELYQRHATALLAYIRRYVFTREDAEDVLLEVFLAAMERGALADVSSGEQLAWLRRVAHNKCVDLYRRQRRHPMVPLESVAEILYEDESRTPEATTLRREEHALLRRHMARLSPQQQIVLHLRFAENLHSPEIARQLHKSESGVRMLLARALNRLHQLSHRGMDQDE